MLGKCKFLIPFNNSVYIYPCWLWRIEFNANIFFIGQEVNWIIGLLIYHLDNEWRWCRIRPVKCIPMRIAIRRKKRRIKIDVYKWENFHVYLPNAKKKLLLWLHTWRQKESFSTIHFYAVPKLHITLVSET